MDNPTKSPAGRLKAHPYVWNLLLIAATVTAILVASHFVMRLGTRHGAQRAVPDFTGMPLAEAQRIAAGHDLELKINDSLFVPLYAGGTVLDQLPRAGVEVKAGRAVYLTINSFAQKQVDVPYVAGRSLRQAKNMLEVAGLGIDRLVYREDLATNYVLAEYCDGVAVERNGQLRAEMGSGVELHVGVAPGEEATLMPKIVGMTLREARSRLWETGFNVGAVRFDEGIDLLNQKDARVWSQEPAQGSDIRLGDAVTLRLTLDSGKVRQGSIASDEQARTLAEERQRAELALADSLAQAEVEEHVRRLRGELPAEETLPQEAPDRRIYRHPTAAEQPAAPDGTSAPAGNLPETTTEEEEFF